MSAICRNHKSPDDFVVQLEAPTINCRPDLDPRKIRKPGAAPIKPVDVKALILKYVPQEPMRVPKGDLYSICSRAGVREDEFLAALSDLAGIDNLIIRHVEGESEIAYSTPEE